MYPIALITASHVGLLRFLKALPDDCSPYDVVACFI